MRQRFCIILNPSAGVPRKRFIADVLARLAARGAITTVVEPRNRSEAAIAVREACSTHDVIVAAGGDGTVRHAAAALGSLAMPLGLIPLGTGNVLAREIGLQLDAVFVADTLVDGEERIVHGATANGEPFFLMAGAGFDGRVIGCLNQSLKRRMARAAYAPAMIRALLQPIDRLQITIDGIPHSANWAIAANARHYGGSFIVSPNSSIFEPGLKVMMIQADTRRDLVVQLLRIAQGSLAKGGHASVNVLDGQKIRIAALSNIVEPVLSQLDGDAYSALPIEIDARGPQLRLIVPR